MSSEPVIRVAFFLGVFLVVATWEAMAPRRRRKLSRWTRWPANLGIVALNTALLRFLLPTTAVAFAILGEQRGWGLLNNLDWPHWLAIALAILALDLAIYLQHVVFHKVPWLWRLHRVHHSDVSFDTTTAIRFHPIEIVLSMLYKILLVIGVGVTPLTVVVFEAVLNACAQFNHGNVRLPAAAERICRWVLITPDLHRIHHSTNRSETDSNFGFSVPWWDRCFRTYCPAPKLGQSSMEIGLQDQRDSSQLGLLSLLRMPFSHLRAPRD